MGTRAEIPGTGAAPGAPDPAGSSGAAGAAGGSPSPNGQGGSADSADPKDALIQKFQSQADHSAAVLKKYGKLTPEVMARYGTGNDDEIIERCNLVESMVQDPKGLAMVRAVQQGASIDEALGLLGTAGSGGGNPNDDPYRSPEEQKIEELERKIQRLEGQGRKTTFSQARDILGRHLTELMSTEYAGLTPERQKAVLEGAQANLRSYERQGEVGEQALQAMMTERGREVVAGLLSAQLQRADFQAMAEHDAARKAGRLRNMTTDSPSGGLSLGDEPPPDFTRDEQGKPRPLQAAAHDAFQWAMENVDRLPPV